MAIVDEINVKCDGETVTEIVDGNGQTLKTLSAEVENADQYYKPEVINAGGELTAGSTIAAGTYFSGAATVPSGGASAGTITKYGHNAYSLSKAATLDGTEIESGSIVIQLKENAGDALDNNQILLMYPSSSATTGAGKIIIFRLGGKILGMYSNQNDRGNQNILNASYTTNKMYAYFKPTIANANYNVYRVAYSDIGWEY